MVEAINYVSSLIKDVNKELQLPPGTSDVACVKGEYLYYHYGCDGFDDRGWGCGYRTLMMLCSWIREQLGHNSGDTLENPAPIPSNLEIQKLLVEIGDKDKEFLNSKEWIGSVEVSMVISSLYETPCKIIHMNSGLELKNYIDILFEHFRNFGSPIMMGGDTDNSSKGIVGICSNNNSTSLLVVDPHFWGKANDRTTLISSGWVEWKDIEEFMANSFYNLCLPQLSAKIYG